MVHRPATQVVDVDDLFACVGLVRLQKAGFGLIAYRASCERRMSARIGTISELAAGLH
ncbi:hypothetical protein RESH_03118 [Rhodopirellula europaea SH398]|uniref:Uncharacterized protein n=1 Tax=Rhodopirellula europaea SH398 TaxID=1263868 RepID=M5SF62_9BACT|nr:hypothetical protein RESH_03118 [Rhodopirellula europaea SH398]